MRRNSTPTPPDRQPDQQEIQRAFQNRPKSKVVAIDTDFCRIVSRNQAIFLSCLVQHYNQCCLDSKADRRGYVPCGMADLSDSPFHWTRAQQKRNLAALSASGLIRLRSHGQGGRWLFVDSEAIEAALESTP